MPDDEKLLCPSSLGMRFFLLMRKMMQETGEIHAPSEEETLVELRGLTGEERAEMLAVLRGTDAFLREIIVEHGGVLPATEAVGERG